jgi:thiol-disulfide isomerase/thioredoxin
VIRISWNKSRGKSTKNKFFRIGNIKIFIILLFIIIIIVIGSIYSSTLIDKTSDVNNSEIDEGEDFSFIGIDGSNMRLSDYRGKIVILDMWATWCQPCQYQMIELEKVYKNHSRNDLEILSIDIDSRETAQQIEQFIDQFSQFGYELNWIFGLEDTSLDEYMPSGSIPTLCIFDQKGNLYYSHKGFIPYHEIPLGFPENSVTLSQKINELR